MHAYTIQFTANDRIIFLDQRRSLRWRRGKLEGWWFQETGIYFYMDKDIG
jgi:hypothetical protein